MDLKEKSKLESKYRDAVRDFNKIFAYRLIKPWFYLDFIFAFLLVGLSFILQVNTYIMFLTILLSPILFLFVLHCFIRYGRKGRILSRIPEPKAYPIIGNIHRFQVDNERQLEKLWKVDKKFYPIYKIWSFFFCSIHLLHPVDIEVLMRSTKYIEKGMPYKCLKPWLSTGLLTSGGEKWQTRRKILTPAFHFNILKHFVAILNKEARYLVTSLKEESKGASVVKDLQKFISQHTLNIICVGRLQKKLLKTLHSFSKKIITERIRFHEQTNRKYLYNLEEMNENNIFSEIPENNNSMFKNRLALLDLLIDAFLNGNQIDEEGIREEVDTFMFEGHDTTAVALCYALGLFAKHKDVQERIRNEVDTIMQQNDYELTISVLQEFSYLERCLKESLRLYPSVHSIFRHLTQDLQLKNYLLPAGSICYINIYSIHRNPEYWPNPEVFDPDRFLPEKIKGRNPYSYIPFSAGPRNCIGQRFAMLELKLIVAYILHNFYLEPVDQFDDIKIMADLTLSLLKPFRVKFIPIK
ncbi:hypothetical protein HZH66_010392 [Vespula vulgaris]|uniref:Cytochrome P450 n=1 Tax=Vespula vulgaris TaxID=7454 RepID=A0A834MYI7_VESVU|nr:hypothetical protein HZH66_010392 [Vespula vulgaris]